MGGVGVGGAGRGGERGGDGGWGRKTHIKFLRTEIFICTPQIRHYLYSITLYQTQRH